MNLTEEQLKVVEEMAELFFLPYEIAENIEIDPIDFSIEIQDKTTAAAQAFFKGTLKGEIPLRKAISQAAHNGSSPAQQMLMDIRRKSKINQI
jgi:hypothetical protein